MGHKKKGSQDKNKKHKPSHPAKTGARSTATAVDSPQKLDLVVKCDTAGCLEAVEAAVLAAMPPELEVNIFYAGIGMINNSDVFMAESGSRLIIGFNVRTSQKIEAILEQCRVEIRIYEVIYRLVDDLKKIAQSLLPPPETEEKIIGRSKIIALFKGARKGGILGCHVEEGKLSVGERFRIINATGTCYIGEIKSLHIERDAVRSASAGQNVGLKVNDFKKVKIGDLVESFRPAPPRKSRAWLPKPGISNH